MEPDHNATIHSESIQSDAGGREAKERKGKEKVSTTIQPVNKVFYPQALKYAATYINSATHHHAHTCFIREKR